MTKLKQELNRICKDWCPMSEICSIDHICNEIKEIRNLIIKIATMDSEIIED